MRLVPPIGFEPMTPGLGNLCSILLSYEGTPFSLLEKPLRLSNFGFRLGPILFRFTNVLPIFKKIAPTPSRPLRPGKGNDLAQ
jgi:hypothetical protein